MVGRYRPVCRSTGVTMNAADRHGQRARRPGNGAYPSGNSLLVHGRGRGADHRPVGDGRRARRGARSPSTPSSTATATRTTSPATARSPTPASTSTTRTCRASHSLEGLMDVYGLPIDHEFATDDRRGVPLHAASRRPGLRGRPRLRPRRRTTVEAVHLPGHTRGHSGFRISERRVLPLRHRPHRLRARTTATCGATSRTSRRASPRSATRTPTSTSRSTTRA